MISFFSVFTLSKLVSQLEEKNFLSWMHENDLLFSGEEYHFRLGIFLSNQRYINEFNRKNKSYKLALNKYAHMTETEINAIVSGSKIMSFHETTNENPPLPTEVPESFDWRDKGVVTEPRNQGGCGCCWAFSTTAALESLSAINGEKLTYFSPQMYLDCVEMCGGCYGCDPRLAVSEYIRKFDGKSVTEEEYPYVGYQCTCRSSIKPSVGSLKGYGAITMYDEEELKARVSQCPVVVCSQFSIISIVYYSSGIFDDEQCMGLNYDHALSLVGYGTENSVDYWIVKNSMGKEWGENGYIRYIRHKNMCGIASHATFIY